MIKMSIKSAKRLGYSIKGYEFVKGYKTPQPILKKNEIKKNKRKKSVEKRIKLIDEGRICRLDIN